MERKPKQIGTGARRRDAMRCTGRGEDVRAMAGPAAWRQARWLFAPATLFLVLICALPAAAQEALRIGYLAMRVLPRMPASFLDPPPADEGVQGARLGLEDNATTGRFTGQRFVLEERLTTDPEAALEAFRELAGSGLRLVVADLPAELLLRVAGLPEADGVTLLNVSAADDALRNEACRANLLHLAPSRGMLTDALVQFLVVKRWRNIFLAVGPNEDDRLYAEAVRRSARKFGARIVADREWTHQPGAQRTDTGHVSIAAEAARFTQGAPAHDVVVVADETGFWGDSLAYRTTEPRPVAGTHGLTPTHWARPHEQWGATQLQRRFLAHAGRWMTPLDHAAWLALRAIGEGATRSRSIDPAAVMAHLRGPRFDLAGFKGARLSFRAWDGQLRQPILLAEPRALVSVSPQTGFQHRSSELDTLGTDQPETRCRIR
jgi:ABC transporter substrate binding protein (PQQ-dependent alcohol dehydrogenase system)